MSESIRKSHFEDEHSEKSRQSSSKIVFILGKKFREYSLEVTLVVVLNPPNLGRELTTLYFSKRVDLLYYVAKFGGISSIPF